jgi:glycosyltransferase involved in cell wall biosynthesis
MPEITILMPCLNEDATLGICINKAMQAIDDHNLDAEILISDNGSTDNSIMIANSLGVRVISVKEKGYGNVLRSGIAHAQGKYVIMADSDNSYDFHYLLPFVIKLREDNDLVMGNRFLGGIEPNAMPFLHKYLGNPVLSFIGRLFFNISIGDFHCGFRGFNREAMLGNNLFTTGMEFASEMVIKSSLNRQKIVEIPVRLYKDGRQRSSHLRTWHDGWRHLRFLLLFSPSWLFLYPGLAMVFFGVIITIVLLPSPLTIGHIKLDVHTMLYSASLIVIGTQMITFYYFSRLFGEKEGVHYNRKWLSRFNEYFSLEKGLIIGGGILLVGVVLLLYSVNLWTNKSFGNLQPSKMLRIIIPSVTCLMLGIQLIFNSFFASILNLNIRHASPVPEYKNVDVLHMYKADILSDW